MGGHVAEKLFIGSDKITAGCSSDLKGATQQAVQAVRHSGMFGDSAGYSSTDFDSDSQKHQDQVDKVVKTILDVSTALLVLSFLV